MKNSNLLPSLLLCLGWFLCFQLESQSQAARLLLIQSGSVGVRGNIVFRLTEVGAGSPADRAGLRPNDLILKIDGRRIHGDEDVNATILDNLKPPGQVYVIEYLRPAPEAQGYRIKTATVRSEVYAFPHGKP